MQATTTQNEVIITGKTEGKNYRIFEVTCGKTSVTIGFMSYGVHVCYNNASHRAYRGAGKMFRNIDEVLNNYKSEAMRKIIFATAAA
jgi:hypothetical protein